QRCGTPRELRLSPPAFRYQVVQRAQKAGKRIVLPEGSEPRTVQAAAICQARGIARCVLLAKPDEVQAVAQAQGIVLPEGLEIIDPDLVRQRYVEPMV
ncbi:phosphate acetyltransferase, partial [Pseudomonas aeruginosa]|nr:phosphate acetyltransferase [Pseudomonas aeruginosa]